MNPCTIAINLRPIPLILKCPVCQIQHVDQDEWAEKPHREHLCHNCGHLWRPASVHTVGVQALPLCGIVKHEDAVMHLVSITLAPSTRGR